MKLMKRLLILMLGIALIVACRAQTYDDEGYPEGYPRLRSVGNAWNGQTVDHVNKTIDRANYLTIQNDSLWWGYNWDFNEASTGYFMFYDPITRQMTYDDTTGFGGGGGGTGFWERIGTYVRPVTIHDDIFPNGVSNIGSVTSPFAETYSQSYFGTWMGELVASSRIDIALSGKTYNGVNLSTSEEANEVLNGLGNYVEIVNFEHIEFDPTPSEPITPPAGYTWWNAYENTLNISTGLGPILQVGQENQITIYNGSAVAIGNGDLVHPIGEAYQGRPTVGLANAKTHEGFAGKLLVATMPIPAYSFGMAATTGRVNGLNTTSATKQNLVYLDTIDGQWTTVAHVFPYYRVPVGGIDSVHATSGSFQLNIKDDYQNTLDNFFNGTFRETFNFYVTSNGTIITGSLNPANGNEDMTMLFSDGFSMLTTTPAATIALTPGTDINPQMNYIYVPIDTKVLTVGISDWPAIEHIKVSKVYLQSATGTQTSGALRNQNYNDHIQGVDGTGHLSHITDKLRSFEAQYYTGITPAMSITQGTPDIVYFSNTSGKVRQLHLQTFPAYDMALGDEVFVINDPTTAYTRLTDIADISLDALGVSLNNKSFSIVLWGVMNKSNEPSHIMVNLPSGSYGYNSPEDAENDLLRYANYNIPGNYQGVGFLIAKYNLTQFNGQWTVYSLEDLRGQVPNISAGGGTVSGGGSTSFTGLDDTPSSYTGEAAKYLIVNGTETGIEFSSDAGAYVASNGNTLNGNAIEWGGTLYRNTSVLTNGLGLNITNNGSGWYSNADGEAFLLNTSGDNYTKSKVGTRLNAGDYEAYMQSDNYYYTNRFAELVVQDDSVYVAFGYNPTDYDFVITETTFKASNIPDAVGPKNLFYDPVTFQITYSDPTGASAEDSIQGSTIYHAKGDRQYFAFGKGGTVTTTDILGVYEISEDTIIFDEVKIECTGTSADMDLRLFHGASWTAGSGGTPIQAAINVVTGAESTSTIFTITDLPPGDDIWCMATTVTTTSEMLIFKLFFHEIDGD